MQLIQYDSEPYDIGIIILNESLQERETTL